MTRKKPKRPMTGADWHRVLEIQRRSKRFGGALSAAELELVTRALAIDPDRYRRQADQAHDDVRPDRGMRGDE